MILNDVSKEFARAIIILHYYIVCLHVARPGRGAGGHGVKRNRKGLLKGLWSLFLKTIVNYKLQDLIFKFKTVPNYF